MKGDAASRRKDSRFGQSAVVAIDVGCPRLVACCHRSPSFSDQLLSASFFSSSSSFKTWNSLSVAGGPASKPLVPEHDGLEANPDIPPTLSAIKNPTPKISYDESTHKACIPVPAIPAGEPLACLVLGGRRDVLAFSSLEVDLSAVEPGAVLSVKWRGKPVFVWHRTKEDIRVANPVDLSNLRHPQPDSERVIKPESVLGCAPTSAASSCRIPATLVGGSAPAMAPPYDSSGRMRKGPAPFNLEVPAYSLLDENKVLIG